MDSVDQAILKRRSVSPLLMNGNAISDSVIRELLALGDWAPTHANTEPWHFTVFSGEQVTKFCHDHSELYREQTAADKFDPAKFEKLRSLTRASHILAIAMKRNPKLPEVEEIAAVACAVQNIWLAAAARGIVGYWGSGGMTYHPAMRDYLELKETDRVLGFLYLGYIDGEWPTGRRLKPLESKIRWI